MKILTNKTRDCQFAMHSIFINHYDKLQTVIKKITTLIFDVDGVLTDGIVILSPDGDLLRTMNVKDGYALKKAAINGYRIANNYRRQIRTCCQTIYRPWGV